MEQDKSRPTGFTPNIEIEDGYVTGFQNIPGASPTQLPQNTGSTSYPEIEYNEINYGVTVNALADQAALTTAAQTATRFNSRLLNAVDICADRQHGLQVVEGYVSGSTMVQCSDTNHHAAHRAGDAVDFRPDNTTISDWYNLYTSALNAVTFVEAFHNESLEMHITTDTSTGNPNQQELDENAALLWERLQQAEESADPILTAAPAVQHLDKMRLHLGVVSMAAARTAAMNNTRWLTLTGDATTGPALPGKRLRIEVQTVGIQDGTDVHVFIMSELFIKTIPPDIRNIATLQTVYGSRDFDIGQIEGHETRPSGTDSYVQRVKKQVSGVDGEGRATLVCDWQVPDVISHGTGRFYALCIVAAGATRTWGGTTAEHTVAEVTAAAQITVPHIASTAWATDSAGNTRTAVISLRDHEQAYLAVDTAGLPAGCELHAVVEDLREEEEVLNTTRTATEGSATTVFTCAAPRRKGEYHATVRVSHASESIDLTSGAGLEWVKRL